MEIIYAATTTVDGKTCSRSFDGSVDGLHKAVIDLYYDTKRNDEGDLIEILKDQLWFYLNEKYGDGNGKVIIDCIEELRMFGRIYYIVK